MTVAEPIIVVLGPWCGGTSAVAKVLHHLGVLMGTRFDVGVRELDDTWEDSDLSLLCRRAFSEPGGQLLMDVHTLRVKLRDWAVNHRLAARTAERRPGVKHPALCIAVDHIRGRYWLDLDQGWRFFAPDNYITRLTAILDAEPEVFQVGINLNDATSLSGVSAPETSVRRTPDGGRYVLTGVMAEGPAIYDTGRPDQAGSLDVAATLDEVLCIDCAD
jgi:hypothetical protein